MMVVKYSWWVITFNFITRSGVREDEQGEDQTKDLIYLI